MFAPSSAGSERPAFLFFVQIGPSIAGGRSGPAPAGPFWETQRFFAGFQGAGSSISITPWERVPLPIFAVFISDRLKLISSNCGQL